MKPVDNSEARFRARIFSKRFIADSLTLFFIITFMNALQAALDKCCLCVIFIFRWGLVFNFFLIILVKFGCFCLKIAADVVCVFVQKFAVKPAIFLLNLPVNFSQYGNKVVLKLIFCQRLISCHKTLQILTVLRSDKFALRLHVEKLCGSEIDFL